MSISWLDQIQSPALLDKWSYCIAKEVMTAYDQESDWTYHSFRVVELAGGVRALQIGGEFDLKKGKSLQPVDSLDDEDIPQADQSGDQQQNGDRSDSSSLIDQIGRDLSINCLLQCSRSDYGSIASLNRSFRSLIRSGELYQLRRQLKIKEEWVYYSCNLFEWEAFDPNCRRWMSLPPVCSNGCFMCSDKESLAVGPELHVFGKDIFAHVVYKYSMLTNSWSFGMTMNTPKSLFGSASMGTIAIVAGGCDLKGNCMNTAELYDSETETWITLPNMHKARKMCSGVFMDGKFYVIGGVGERLSDVLTCGEEYDMDARSWREIPNMFPSQNGGTGISDLTTLSAPPLLAVAKNELYAAHYQEHEVRKYDKVTNSWTRVGSLPPNLSSMNGWGLAFRTCGDKLMVVGGPSAPFGGRLEINAWEPNEGPLEWELLASKPSSNFVFNCAVMGC